MVIQKPEFYHYPYLSTVVQHEANVTHVPQTMWTYN